MRRKVYTRPPGKPLRIAMRHRNLAPEVDPTTLPPPLVVDKATECHVTPQDVADRMVDYLGPCGDLRTLEPSAGTGNLIEALINAGQEPTKVVAIERHVELWRVMRERFGKKVGGFNRCFLEYADEVRGKVEFPRVIMNAPFKSVRAHVAAAISLMGGNGQCETPVLVACVPTTFDHPQAEFMEDLPPDTFATARVYTKLIRITCE